MRRLLPRPRAATVSGVGCLALLTVLGACAGEPRVELTSDNGALALSYACTEAGPRPLDSEAVDLVRNVVARENAEHILADTNPLGGTVEAAAVREAFTGTDLRALETAVARFVCVHGEAQPRPPRFPEAGSTPPDFVLVPQFPSEASYPGARLAELRGRTVIVVFWSTWCEACREEYEVLRQLSARSASEPVSTFAILHQESESRLLEWREEHGGGVEFVKDPGERIARDYLVYGIPHTAVIRPDGLVHVAGHVEPGDLNRVVDEAMAAGRPPATAQ